MNSQVAQWRIETPERSPSTRAPAPADRTLRGKDRVAQLFEQHAAVVLRRARALLGNEADAQEALQEVFIRAIRHEAQFEHEANTIGWFYRVTTNYCLNQFRDGKRRRELLEQHGPCKESEQIRPEPEATITLRLLWARADEREARCAAYLLLDELPHEEVAQRMGVSRRTVSNLLDRFRASARAQLEAKRDMPVGP